MLRKKKDLFKYFIFEDTQLLRIFIKEKNQGWVFEG
jgi:hypothetical protein